MKTKYLFLMIVFLSPGCKKFETILVSETNGVISFDNNNLSEECSDGLYVYGAWIQKQEDTSNSKVMWSFRVPIPSNIEVKENKIEFPLLYGVSPENSPQTINAKLLEQGTYKVSINAACFYNGGFKGVELVSDFTINRNGNLIKNSNPQ